MHTRAIKKYVLLSFMLVLFLLCVALAFVLLSNSKIVSVCATALDLSDVPNITISLKYQGHCFIYNSNFIIFRI